MRRALDHSSVARQHTSFDPLVMARLLRTMTAVPDALSLLGSPEDFIRPFWAASVFFLTVSTKWLRSCCTEQPAATHTSEHAQTTLHHGAEGTYSSDILAGEGGAKDEDNMLDCALFDSTCERHCTVPSQVLDGFEEELELRQGKVARIVSILCKAESVIHSFNHPRPKRVPRGDEPAWRTHQAACSCAARISEASTRRTWKHRSKRLLVPQEPPKHARRNTTYARNSRRSRARSWFRSICRSITHHAA